MAQNVLVDLDLNQNSITNLADGVDDGDAVNKLQVETAISDVAVGKADAATTLTAGNGLAGGGDLSQNRGFDVGAGVGITVATDSVAVDQTWLTTFVQDNSANNIEAGGGIDVAVGTGANGADVISVDVSDTLNNALTLDAGGLYVPTPAATDLSNYYTIPQVDASQAAQDSVIATKASQANLDAEATARLAADNAQQNLLDAEVTARAAGDTALQGNIDAEASARADADTALQGEIDAVEGGLAQEITDRTNADTALTNDLAAEVTARTNADTALDGRINALSITGTGMATVTETATDSGVWTVDVPSLQLANTYTGTGTDSTTINADLADNVPPVTGQPGDLYINSGTGQAFINTGLAAPGDWVELSSAQVGIDSLVEGAGIDIANPAGPAATISIEQGVLDEISASTAANATQDGRLDGIDAAQGVQDSRLDAVEAANITQDTAIGLKADKVTAVNAGAGLTGGGTLGADSTFDVVGGNGITVSADAVAANIGAGLKFSAGGAIELDPAATVVGVAKVVAQDVVVAGGTGTLAHGLNSRDVVVAVKSGLCYVTANVCEVDVNTVSIEANDGTYRVIVTGVQG